MRPAPAGRADVDEAPSYEMDDVLTFVVLRLSSNAGGAGRRFDLAPCCSVFAERKSVEDSAPEMMAPF